MKLKLPTLHFDIRAYAPKIAIFISFFMPIILMYFLEPDSFIIAWKGRVAYCIFLWLFTLELALAWRKLAPKKLIANRWVNVAVAGAVMAAPTVYTVVTLQFGLEKGIVEIGRLVGVPEKYGTWFLETSWPLSIEYLLFTGFFMLSVLLLYRTNGLKRFRISLIFIGATGVFYMIDTFYPYGTFVVLQALVPFTAASSASILNLAGYQTRLLNTVSSVRGPGTVLMASKEGPWYAVAIYWPSAGIHSLFIYTIAILFFLMGFNISLKRKMLCFTVGAAGTFLVNLLRIATISAIGVGIGVVAARNFHDYYGELYFLSWMIIYLTMIYIVWLRPNLRKKPS